MDEPVITPNGHTFEKAAIVNWIQANGTCPVTRRPLVVGDLYDNLAVVEVLLHLVDRDADSTHLSIRQWQDKRRKNGRTKADLSLSIPSSTQQQDSLVLGNDVAVELASLARQINAMSPPSTNHSVRHWLQAQEERDHRELFTFLALVFLATEVVVVVCCQGASQLAVFRMLFAAAVVAAAEF